MSEGGGKRRGENRQLRPNEVDALDEEGGGTGAGTFQKADAATIAKRRIVKISRGGNKVAKPAAAALVQEQTSLPASTNDGAAPNPFASFNGLVTASTSSSSTPSKSCLTAPSSSSGSSPNPFVGFSGLTGPSSVEGARSVTGSFALSVPAVGGGVVVGEGGNADSTRPTKASNPFAGFTGLTAPSPSSPLLGAGPAAATTKGAAETATLPSSPLKVQPTPSTSVPSSPASPSSLSNEAEATVGSGSKATAAAAAAAAVVDS
mmetsp:Transcript_14634/g.30062  ORF Transcript_14634/g.30062 Transcript_14634/m.30062 type:complete len:262 (+) Transcript_14634:13-798(+)